MRFMNVSKTLLKRLGVFHPISVFLVVPYTVFKNLSDAREERSLLFTGFGLF